jgi:hypothetical protein
MNIQSCNIRLNAQILRIVGVDRRRAIDAVVESYRMMFASIGTKRHFDLINCKFEHNRRCDPKSNSARAVCPT